MVCNSSCPWSLFTGSGDHTSSPLSIKALETIDILRSQLERCQADLQTDEELFAEKMEEMSELQQNYEEIISEKSRLEILWVAAQQSEGALKNELLSVLEEVTILERELVDREQMIQHQTFLLDGGGGSNEKKYIDDDGEGETPSVGEIPSTEVDKGTSHGLVANRSLIVGKVSTSKLEVRSYSYKVKL